MSREILILCGAFAGELEALQELDGWQIDTVGVPTGISIRESGIGNISAAISVMRWHNEARQSGMVIEEILFLGSCGTYNAESRPDAVFARTFYSYELCTLTDPPRAKALPSASGPVTTTCGWAGELLSRHVPEFAVNSPDAVSLDEVESSVLQKVTGSRLPFAENLEVFGMARAALECGVKFSAFLGVTNAVHAGGSEEWQRNHRKAADYIAAQVKKVLFPKN
jgi:nucleoside phosphorylase